jgi:hypothetical protein
MTRTGLLTLTCFLSSIRCQQERVQRSQRSQQSKETLRQPEHRSKSGEFRPFFAYAVGGTGQSCSR